MSTRRWIPVAALLPLVALVLMAASMGVRLWNVTSGSMEPQIPAHAAVLTLPLQPQTGQVQVYSDPVRARVVAHRLIGQDQEGLIFRGDAVTARDSPVQTEKVLGQVVMIIPGAGQGIVAATAVLLAVAAFALAYALMPAGFFKH